MLKVDLSNVWGDLSLPDLLATEQEVFAAHKTLAEGRGPGNDFLGWLELPTFEETEELQRIRRAAERIRADSDVFVVVGIGGSYLGPRAARGQGFLHQHHLEVRHHNGACHRHPRPALDARAQVRRDGAEAAR